VYNGDGMNVKNSPFIDTRHKYILTTFLVIFIALLACARASGPISAPWSVSTSAPSTPDLPVETEADSSSVAFLPITHQGGDPVYTPTPDTPHILPTPRTDPEKYVVRQNDTLGLIAQRFRVTIDALIKANKLTNPDILEVGQTLIIPILDPGDEGPGFKIIPDSELVYGPASTTLNIQEFINAKDGYLSTYKEKVDDEMMKGAEIVKRVSYEYSTNPRLLLAVLEYQSGWVTQKDPDPSTLDYPIGWEDELRKGLYKQLAWAANNLNRGYYLWRVGGIGTWVLANGDVVPIASTINAGTAGIQHFFSLLYGPRRWNPAVSSEGLVATYITFFGYPFDLTVDPLVPPDLQQPKFHLPFEPGKEWYFTGGPHGGWGDGSGWGALDFAPPGEALGCVTSDEWVVAVADGPIIRADNGEVVQDIDLKNSPADGLEQTGWTVLYMHIESRDRVHAGSYLHAGDRVGHPSCEGGYSTGTHLHIARRYNGEWIPADQTLPFVMDGWVARGTGIEYDGYLEKNGQTVQALEGRLPSNAIQR